MSKVVKISQDATTEKTPTSFEILRDVYERAPVLKTGKHFTTVNELCDQVPALRPETLRAAVEEALQHGTFGANKILTEEDKGAPIAAAMSLAVDLPLSIARWYPYDVPGQVKVEIVSEYFTGSLYMNGVVPGDKVLIIEDTLSTGGTMIALIEAVRKVGADVVGAIAIIEKVGNDGHRTVLSKTGVDVKTCVQIDVKASGVTVLPKNSRCKSAAQMLATGS
jgi:adenine phosphoribosyltransferase